MTRPPGTLIRNTTASRINHWITAGCFVLIGLAVFLTIVIVQPVAQDIYHKAWEPMDQGKMTATQAFDEGSKPLKTFLARFAREKDIKLFVDVTKAPAPRNQGLDSENH